MDAWRERRFGVMQTWTAAGSGPDATRAQLRERYGPLRLRGWSIRSSGPGGASGAIAYRVEIAYRTLLDPELRRTTLELRVARRDAQGEPAGRRGAWGVDPLPRLRETPP